VATVIELLAAALATGVSVPRALFGVGQAVGGTTGQKLSRAGRQLELGATWVQAWAEAESDLAVIVEALQAAWEDGAPPIETLRAASQAERQRQKAAAKLAAARLGVRLVLPLGLCLLPAFVLIGLVPILISLGSLLVF
jgi:tight adherence protein B